MTLKGRRIVITRAKHQADELAQLILAEGGIPVLYPCIEIAPPDNPQALDAALHTILDYDWIIFTSTNAVHAVQSRIQMLKLAVNWEPIKIAAVGSKTASAIKELLGIDADFTPTLHASKQLGEELTFKPQDKILLPQSALTDDDLAHHLSKRAANVTAVEAYNNHIATGGENVPLLIRQNLIDAITFTSSSTVNNFLKRIAPIEPFHIPAICIGSRTCHTAIEVGFQAVSYPENYTISDMLNLLVRLFDEVKHDST